MCKEKIFAIVSFIFVFTYADLYSPEVWYGFRSDSLVFSAGVSESDLNKTVYYELLYKKQGGKNSILASKNIKAVEREWTLAFSDIKKDVAGKDALWVKETIGDEKSKIYGPYGFVKNKLSEICDTAINYSGDIKNYELNKNTKFSDNKSFAIQFLHNQNGLIIVFGDVKEKITISIDPANSKTAFLAFANRIIMFDTDKKAAFFYPERSIVQKTSDIQYKIRDWEGDMTVSDGQNCKIIFIPWYDLGVKYENGRKFGFMIQHGDYSYPFGASSYSPASWGNIIIK
ncbi:MAG: hypothetical protein LBH98_06825 [Chitinispirillales bacterium]|jgi:hypothetical protein|nr:hypothetical protein [Chitinispirillales bacterium]